MGSGSICSVRRDLNTRHFGLQIEDIKDEQSLRAWLEEQDSYEVSVTIAVRAALRVQPWLRVTLLSKSQPEEDSLAILLVRSVLATAVGSQMRAKQTFSIAEDVCEQLASSSARRSISTAASHAADERNRVFHEQGIRRTTRYLASESAGLRIAEGAITRAIECSVQAVTRESIKFSAEAVSQAVVAADQRHAATLAASQYADETASSEANEIAARVIPNLAGAVWEQTRYDCAELFENQRIWMSRLWREERRVDGDWQSTKAAWQAAGAPWDRFARVFDDFWEGREPDWTYLEQIVLIGPEIWKAGPKAIAEAIAEIDAKTEDDVSTSSTGDLTEAFKRSANAERVVFNEETKKFRLEPLSDLSDSEAADCIEILSNVLMIFDFEDPASNQYRAVQEEWELIRLAVDRYANRPRMLYSTCMRVFRRLTTKFASGECPDPAQDANIGDFHLTIMGVAAELRSRDPKVQEALFNAERVNLQPLLARDEEVLEKAVTEVSEISEGALADELPIDLSITLDPSASAEDQRDARLALGGRLIRVFVSCYRGFKASLTEVEQVTKSAAGIATNSAKVTAAVGGITMPLWLEKAVAVVQLWF